MATLVSAMALPVAPVASHNAATASTSSTSSACLCPLPGSSFCSCHRWSSNLRSSKAGCRSLVRSYGVRCMAPEEDKMTKRSPLDFPIEWDRPAPGRRPDIFPQFSPMKAPLPPPLPCDPPGPDEDEEEEEEEKPEKEEGEEEKKKKEEPQDPPERPREI